jgi:hypothetical protein
LYVMRTSAGIALVCLIVSASATSVSAQSAPSVDCVRSGVDDKCESWTTTYDDDELSPTASESPAEIVVSPRGDTIYALMRATVGAGFDGKTRWVVIAYDTDGAQLWMARYGDPTVHNIPTSIDVSPDGRLVYISGTWKVDQVAADGHLTTIALDATNGDVVWSATYDGPGNGTDNARDIIVSPDGRTLYVAGISGGAPNGHLDYLALAYDARTGGQEWATRWDGIGVGNRDSPFAAAVNARGSMLYLTGHSYGEGEFNNDFGTIAIATKGADEGSIAWTARYDGVGVHAPDQAEAIAVSPDDSKIFVTGMSNDVDGGPPFDVNYGFATIAYDAYSGEQLWEARRYWPDSNFNSPTSITVDPSGGRVIATGQVGRGSLDFGTVAYDASTGAEVWSDRYAFQDYDLELGKHIAMDPRGDTLYVTGVSAKSPPGVPGLVLYAPNADQLTIAYDVATGAREWLARFNPATTDFVSVQTMAVSPDATTVYAGAAVDDQNWDNDGDDNDAALIAYEIGPGIPLPQPPATKLEFVGALRGDHSDDAALAARLTNSFGDPIVNAEVVLDFAGETATVRTNEDGVARLAIRLTERPGSLPINASFAGEEGVYGGTTADATFRIDKEDVDLSLKIKRGRRSLQARLVDADSAAPVAGRKIVFFVGKTKLGSATTDATGRADRRIPARVSLDRSFKATFSGDDFYGRDAARR